MEGALMVVRRLAWRVAIVATLMALFAVTPALAENGVSRVLSTTPSNTSQKMSPEEFVNRLRSGNLQEYVGLTITGTVNLTGLRTVGQPIRCLGCTFDGSILSSDAVFERTVILSGAHVKGAMEFSGAVFRSGFFLRTANVGLSGSGIHSLVDGESNFSLAMFSGSAGFDEATLLGPAKFDGARFGSDVSFADTDFVRGASFDLGSFVGTALFTGSPRSAPSSSNDECLATQAGSIAGEARFRQASFSGTADFRGRCFSGHADFRSASFGGVVNFSQARFVTVSASCGPDTPCRTDFSSSTFQANGLFLATIFERDASFDLVTAARSLTFEGSLFLHEASFQRLVVAGSLSFSETSFAPGRLLDLTRLSTDDLTMDPHDVSHVEEGNNGRSASQREAVLSLIESSARKDGHLGLANDARYQNLALQHQDLKGRSRFIDGFFYRLVGGYLVRPLNPVRFFILLLLIGMAIRGVGRIAELMAAKTAADSEAPTQPVAFPAIFLLPLLGIALPWLKDRRSTSVSNDAVPPPRSTAEADTRSSPQKTKAARVTLGVTKVLSAFVEGFGDSVTVAFRRKPDIKVTDRDRVLQYIVAGVRWFEFLAFKVLIAVFLLCLANSNSTLRDLIDTVKG
jgi:hypothetical protein